MIVSLTEHRHRKALLAAGNYCLSCHAEGEIVELVAVKRWGSPVNGCWCPECGRED